MEKEPTNAETSTSNKATYYPFNGSDLIQLGNHIREMARGLKDAGLEYKWVNQDERKALIRKIEQFVSELNNVWEPIKKKMIKDIDLYLDERA